MPTQVDLSRYDNSWYQPGRPWWLRALWYGVDVAILRNRWIPATAPRVWALRLFGARVGKGVVIRPGVSVKYPWLLRLGNYSWVGQSVWIDNLAQVDIGAHCCLSQGAMLLCGNHRYDRSTFDLETGSITLEDGVWIGARALVGPNTHCGTHAVLGVQSVAVARLEAWGVYRGHPAQWVRRRELRE